MTRFIDYYKLLQVHYLADTEVIEGAYKKLCKKFHPDVNKSITAEDKFKSLNQAYSILSNPETRSLFDKEYAKHFNISAYEDLNSKGYGKTNSSTQDSHLGALYALNSYFDGLISRDYLLAYNNISNHDKKNISEVDFKTWQQTVSQLYEIKSYKCVFIGKGSMKSTHGGHARILEFHVCLEELDKRSGEVKKVEMSRSVVEDGVGYRVYLGYSDIKDITEKLKELLNDNSEDKMESYGKHEVLLELQREILRANRYERPFTAIFIEVGFGEEYFDEQLIEDLFCVIDKNIRSTDYFKRWNRNRLMLFLPETRIYGGKQTAEKLLEKVRNKFADHGIVLNMGIVQNKGFYLQELLDLLSACLIGALKKGPWNMMY